MADHARSDDPAVQAQLDRFAQLSPGRDILGLERIERLLALLGNPHLLLPPVFHVAGTNGKGSTCAYLRAILEAQGLRVHVYTSPHLARFNERIRVAGRLIEDRVLGPLLADVLDAAEADGLAPSFFEATTAAAFLAFARTPADAAVIEVGLGGRLDATNIIPDPLVCGIASLAIDHESFLLVPEDGTPDEPLERIAFEKAGIAKAGAPLVTQYYTPAMARTIADVASLVGTRSFPRQQAWDIGLSRGLIDYRDINGSLSLPLPAMPGQHQAENAGLAVAMIRHQNRLKISSEAMEKGIASARWPARMQLLSDGPVVRVAPDLSEIWLDGGHNPDAATIIARHFAQDMDRLGKVDFVMGMLASKDAQRYLEIIAPVTGSLIAVPVPGHEHHAPATLVGLARKAGITEAGTAPDVVSALSFHSRRQRPENGFRRAAILGTLYLAGMVLKDNDQLPE